MPVLNLNEDASPIPAIACLVADLYQRDEGIHARQVVLLNLPLNLLVCHFLTIRRRELGITLTVKVAGKQEKLDVPYYGEDVLKQD